MGFTFGIVFAWLFYSGFFSHLENSLIDSRFRARGEMPGTGKVVLVGITDSCINRLGAWPWPRERHAELVKILSDTGAKVISLDIIFNETSLNGPQDDKIFADAIRESGRVVLPVVHKKRIILDNETFEMVHDVRSEHPLDIFRENALGLGFIDIEHEKMNSDGVIRHVFLTCGDDSQTNAHRQQEFASRPDGSAIFGLVAAKLFLDSQLRETPSGIWLGKTFLPHYTRIEKFGESKISSYMINYVGPTGSFNEVSYSDVIEGNFPEGLFKGKLVIVGTRAMGISEDLKFCPFGAVPGMEIHASIAHNVLTGRVLRRFSPLSLALVILVTAQLLALFMMKFHGLRGNIPVFTACIVYLAAGWKAFSHDLVFELVPFMVMIPVQWAVIRLIQQFCALGDRNRMLAKRVKELSMINEVSQAVSFMGDLSKTLDTILSRAVQGLGAQRGSILMLDERYENLVEKAVIYGIDGEASPSAELKELFKVGRGIAGEVFSTGKPRLIADIARSGGMVIEGGNLKLTSLICVPLSIRETPIGVMNISNKLEDRFDNEDLQLALTMANQAAIVIEKARLFNLATIDGLTGLIVHRHFQAKLEEEFRRARRYDKPLSLLMTDIDHFKLFNDTWGHQVGDQVLREVAGCARNTIRGTDVAARYGGEEFSIILPETDLEGGVLFAERLRQRVEQMVFHGPKGDLQVTISIGLSSIPHNSVESTVEMLKAADEALYCAKHGGRNRVGVAPGSDL